ncbi:restriction endonuclease [Halomonas eurihalina]|uniref:Restriction endonuclease n=1 Tax=Halomonas eurihalina TaxID=42566 RepID=A0A5D9DAE9_HALER|nr:type I restriction endonuclease [Halomonas eurihalina]MDR5859401.1 type I restriction enzyme HsdR N-terminal domain-containing protein [Halomonas eurihalina]TZG40559.1 restriction endonuclease [Halomonas eurihalina]
MELKEKLSGIARRGQEQAGHINNEEATKTALVLPFIGALGYDPFDTREVVPEFTADVGTKKGEKVDFAIRTDGALSILVECKPIGTDLSNVQYSQLYRYFACTDAKFAILTNGFEYRFYSDLDSENKLDNRPFFTFNLDELSDQDIDELKKFSKPNFDIDSILGTANRLKYTNLAKQAIDSVFHEAPEEFIKFIVSQIYDGRQTRQVIEEFTPIIKDACRLYIQEQVALRLQGALVRNAGADASHVEDEPSEDEPDENDDGIVTTQEEIDAYNIVRSILAEDVDISRIAMRDAKSYCAILLDDNNRKPICRLHFNSKSVKRVGFFTEKDEDRVEVKGVADIFQYRDRLKTTLSEYQD